MRDAQDVTNSLYACAELRLQEPRFLAAAAAEAPRWLQGAIATEVRQAAWACAVLRFSPPQLLGGLVARGQQLMQQARPGSSGGGRAPRGRQQRPLSAQDKADVAVTASWAAAVLDARGLEAVDGVLVFGLSSAIR